MGLCITNENSPQSRSGWRAVFRFKADFSLREHDMTWLHNPALLEHAVELVCCFFTVVTVFVSYLLTLR